MGVITLALIAANMQDPGTGPNLLVIIGCAFAIAAGRISIQMRLMSLRPRAANALFA